ncbi:MAG: hypothetical protein ABIP81_01870 [Terriglobales bacterium]
MPTKRRFILFLVVLTLMLLIKRAVGQEAAVGWDPVYSGYDARMPDEMQSLLTKSTIVGFLLGIAKAWMRAVAERRGTYLSGDLIQLRLR